MSLDNFLKKYEHRCFNKTYSIGIFVIDKFVIDKCVIN